MESLSFLLFLEQDIDRYVKNGSWDGDGSAQQTVSTVRSLEKTMKNKYFLHVFFQDEPTKLSLPRSKARVGCVG